MSRDVREACRRVKSPSNACLSDRECAICRAGIEAVVSWTRFVTGNQPGWPTVRLPGNKWRGICRGSVPAVPRTPKRTFLSSHYNQID
ncbi:hypothetical protein BCCH1_77470 (plasmid) [Burkholderia contaminans]|uniref:Uncharacterized protein n=1 Tax=Burkholderia contaminans TaxID=488447 RepID=A0A250LKZ7_9BURK|nr:hypothetical protein BCCH1_77470 [Burkholderia contaminans]